MMLHFSRISRIIVSWADLQYQEPGGQGGERGRAHAAGLPGVLVCFNCVLISGLVYRVYINFLSNLYWETHPLFAQDFPPLNPQSQYLGLVVNEMRMLSVLI